MKKITLGVFAALGMLSLGLNSAFADCVFPQELSVMQKKTYDEQIYQKAGQSELKRLFHKDVVTSNTSTYEQEDGYIKGHTGV